MANKTNRDQWAGRERLLFIERVAWWKGAVQRADVQRVFGISAAQVSADLQSYQELNSTALHYNLRSKRYESTEEMVCVLHEPRIEEAVSLFLGSGVSHVSGALRQSSSPRVDFTQPLARDAGGAVQRRVFLALEQGRRLAVKYWSVNSSSHTQREIAPHALAHDGFRWHVRAWCFENEDFRDFVLSRIEEAGWPGERFQSEEADADWERMERLTLRPHAGLDDDQRQTIIRDYGMQDGKLEVQVRAAMKEYFLAQWRVSGPERPPHLELG